MTSPASGRINIGFVLFCAAVTGIGGFLFGYDTAVINGANTFLQNHFHLLPKQDSLLIGLATASAIIGCVFGAMSAGWISDRFGRRRVLFLCAVLYAVSGVLSALPEQLMFLADLWHRIVGSGSGKADVFVLFILARILSGIAIGISSMVCPVYIAEIAPPAWRGRLGTLFQLGIVVGIFVTLFVNLGIQGLGDEAWNTSLGWRWMLAAEAFPAVLFVVMLFGIPESPKWLIQADREAEARRTLDRVGGKAYADGEVAAVREVLGQEEGTLRELFSRVYRLPLAIALVLMAGSQLSGINVIMYYSTDIFLNAAGIGPMVEQTNAFTQGLEEARTAETMRDAQKELNKAGKALDSKEFASLLSPAELKDLRAAVAVAEAPSTLDDLKQSVVAAQKRIEASPARKKLADIESQARTGAFRNTVWIGLVNLLATFIAIFLVDKAGRKPLLVVGNLIQVVGLALVGILYACNPHSPLLLVFVVIYTAAFAMAMGPLPWVVCSEIFPAKLRGRAMSVSTFCIWVSCLLVAQTFPFVRDHIGPSATFWIYAGCSALTLVFVLVWLPETKGKSLEEIERSWQRR